MTKLESIASSAVRAADKVGASLIIVYTQSGTYRIPHESSPELQTSRSSPLGRQRLKQHTWGMCMRFESRILGTELVTPLKTRIANVVPELAWQAQLDELQGQVCAGQTASLASKAGCQ